MKLRSPEELREQGYYCPACYGDLEEDDPGMFYCKACNSEASEDKIRELLNLPKR